jgi:hypothetical protein
MLCGLLATGAVLAQDGPIEIKIKKTSQGDVVKETKTEDVTNKVTANGMDMEQKAVARFVYIETVIEKAPGAKKATRAKRVYETAELTKDGERVDLGLAGKTVLVEKKGDAYSFTLEGGGQIEPRAAEILGKEFNKKDSPGEEAFLPKKAVKVGESWDVDLELATRELSEGGMIIDKGKSKATGTLKKVYDKNGKRFGVIGVKLDLAVSKVSGGGQDIEMKDGSKLTVELELDGCIDGSAVTGSGVINMTGKMNGEIMGVSLAIALDGKMTSQTEEGKK